MNNIEIISLIVTIVCLISFSIVFTFLFRKYYTSDIKEIELGREDIELLELAKEEKHKNSKNRKALRITGQVFSYTFLAILVAFFSLSLYSRFSNNMMPFGNSTLMVIATGSMSEKNKSNDYLLEFNLTNQIQTYDTIGLTKYESQNDIKLYDVVAFRGKDDKVYVHRIIKINDDNTYITRGDSNNINDTNRLYDGYLKYQDIVGYYNGTNIPLIGVFVVFFQSNSGIITIISIVYCIAMFDYYKTKYENAISKRTKLLIDSLGDDVLEAENIQEIIKIKDTHSIIYNEEEIVLKNIVEEKKDTKFSIIKNKIFKKNPTEEDSKKEE